MSYTTMKRKSLLSKLPYNKKVQAALTDKITKKPPPKSVRGDTKFASLEKFAPKITKEKPLSSSLTDSFSKYKTLRNPKIKRRMGGKVRGYGKAQRGY